MSLVPGTRLGHYEVVGPLGAEWGRSTGRGPRRGSPAKAGLATAFVVRSSEDRS